MFDFFSRKKTENSDVTPNHSKVQTNYNDASALEAYFKQETGVTFEKQRNILKSKLTSFCTVRQIYSFDECLTRLHQDRFFKQELINYLTTNESYFFREYKQVEEFAQTVCAEQKNTHTAIDILCAPCSTGEEVYTIVIALLENGVMPDNYRLIGIDINTDALEGARKGLYSKRNVSKIPPEIVSKYFTQLGEKYQLSDRVIRAVTFKQANVFSHEFAALGKFDYIFSRNMLIYFDKPTKQKAQQIFEGMLKDPAKKIYYGHADIY